MRFIYTGSVDVTLEIAQDLLRAADQYLLEGLKRLCEYTIAQDVSVESVSSMYELSEAFNAISLRHTCILFILEHFDKLSAMPGSKIKFYSLLYAVINKECLHNHTISPLSK
ncbi:ARM repeat protein interacting WITH ABF2 protein, partial [Trifolium medium]|nr:ARM repeat protein interacting WITH ABF2 protein [Trifolium medium]